MPYHNYDSMVAANILQLRQVLAEKFPGLRTRLSESPPVPRDFWRTGLPQIDGPLRGGLPIGALTEIVAEKRGSGSASLISAMVRQAFSQNRLVALIDAQDSFDVTQAGEDLSRLLWVRCRSAEEALKAADMLLRDGNLPLILLDLAINPAKEIRQIQPTTWYRFQRLIEQTSTVCLVFTPRALVNPAQTRVVLQSIFSLDALEGNPDDLVRELKMEVTDPHQSSQRAAFVQKSA